MNGKHMKRCLKVDTFMYLSLFEIFFKHWSVKVDLTRQDAERISVILAIINSTPYENKTELGKQTDKLYEFIDSISWIYWSLASSLTMQGKCLINYMKIFEILMLFIQSSRQCNWDLHFASLHEFAKYFFCSRSTKLL